MAKLIELNLRPDDRMLRQFGGIALVGFGLLALCAWQEWLMFGFGLGEARTAVAGGLLAAGVLAALLGLVFPRANWPLFVGLSLLAFPIGFVLSYVILGSLFYLMITPVALFFRLTRRDPLNRNLEADSESYWDPADPPRAQESYFRQF